MLQAIWATVQLIWNDPVWSKIIAAGITAIVLVIWSYFRGWFPIIGQWLASEIIISKWSLIAFPVLIAAAVWIASEIIQVEPRDQYIAFLTEEVAKRNKIVSEWREAYETHQKQSELLLGNNKTLGKTCEEAITKCQSDFNKCQSRSQECLNVVGKWEKHSAELQKTVNSYVTNCSIISEIRNLDKRKSTIDDNLGSRGYTQEAYEAWKRQSVDFQARMLVFQQKLACEPQ
jgi:hypothetical protein